MIVELEVQEGLQAAWADRIRRQIDFKLASLTAHVRMVRVRLSVTPDKTGNDVYRCTMQATLAGSVVEEAITTGPLPNICVADAAARLARTIARAYKLSDRALRQQSA